MKTKSIAFSGVILLVLMSLCSVAQDDEATLAKIKQDVFSFENKEVNSIYIANSFGDINISKWDENYVEVKIELLVTGWEMDDIEFFIDKLFPTPVYESNQVSMVYDYKHIKDVCCPGKKKVYNPLFGKKATIELFSIQYDIKIPESLNSLDLHNTYGNISLSSFAGKLYIQLRNGNLKTGDLNLENCDCPALSIRHGNINLGDVTNAKLNLYSCDNVKIASLENTTINSSFSNVQIGNVKSLKLQTKSDTYIIDKLDSLKGRGQFTTLSVNYLGSYLDFYNRSGETEIEQINPQFNSISLDGQFNHYALQVANLNYVFSAKLESTEISCHDNICSELFREKALKGSVTLNNRVGKSSAFSKITLNCSSCNIEMIEE